MRRAWRRGKEVRLKDAVDESLAGCDTVKDVIVYRRTARLRCRRARPLVARSDAGVSETCPAEELDKSIRCTCRTRRDDGKLKGTHTMAGYLLQATMTMKCAFDLHEEDTYWCTAISGG